MRIFLFFTLLFNVSLWSQPEGGLKPFSVPPSGNIGVAPSGAAVNAPSIFDAPSKSSGKIEDEPLNKHFANPPEFANSNERYLDKLNKPEGEVATAIRKNQYLGDVRTKSSLVNIKYRDHEAFDGDLIRVWVNDRVVKEEILMESTFEGFELDLLPGFNSVSFEALNQGLSGPNTAEFQIFDDKGILISTNRWNLATGFKATIILVKE